MGQTEIKHLTLALFNILLSMTSNPSPPALRESGCSERYGQSPNLHYDFQTHFYVS